MVRKLTALERLEDHYFIEPNSGCWLWTHSCFPNGYGQTSYGPGKPLGAHRLSYMVHKGPIPDGKIVCHKCDTPSCINPAHLFLGDNKDNSVDMVAKRRQAAGSRHGAAKLTEATIPEIRGLIELGFSDGAIGRRYGVGGGTIHHIRHGRSWTHVAA